MTRAANTGSFGQAGKLYRWVKNSRNEQTHSGLLGLPVFLLHGTGGSWFDEIFIFGGIGLVVGGLIFLSWRAGRDRKKREARRRKRR